MTATRAGGRGRILWPIVRFALLLVVLSLALSLLRADKVFTPVAATGAGWIIRLFSSDVVVRGSVIQGGGFAVNIYYGCDAEDVVILFCAAVLAFPGGWRAKLIGVGAGTLLIVLFNLVRIVSLFYVGVWAPSYFETAHYVVWQLVGIVFATLLFFVWIETGILSRVSAFTLAKRLPFHALFQLPFWVLAREPLAAALAPPAQRLINAYVREGVCALRTEGPTLGFTWARAEDAEEIDRVGNRWRVVPSNAIHINTVLFVALVLGTPEIALAQRLTVFALGLPMLYLADVLTLFAALRWTLVTDFNYLGPAAPSDRWVGFTHYWPQLFLVSVGNQLFPVAAWAAALAFVLRRRRARGAAVRATGRNDPCPCGSGRKYKRCCGAA
jgi:exosortase/archaeosortase family protein